MKGTVDAFFGGAGTEPTEPSFEDMITKLRKTLIAALFSAVRPGQPDPKLLRDDAPTCAAAMGLRLPAVAPPPELCHGTVARFLAQIRAEGLRPGRRAHVHLSVDRQTATTVGARRGRPVILTVDAAGMHQAGHEFFRAANGVWLTRTVPHNGSARSPCPTWLGWELQNIRHIRHFRASDCPLPNQVGHGPNAR